MTTYSHTVGDITYRFGSLKDVMAKASPARSGDYLAGVAADNAEERVAAQMALAETSLRAFLNEALIPYETDEVTRLIVDEHDPQAFAPLSQLTVGDFRNWLLSDAADEHALMALAAGLTAEMVAAVSKLMRIEDRVLVARNCRVITRFRNTIGLEGRLSIRLQPHHPTDDPAGIAASVLDGLLYGNGDAVIGINPASDSTRAVITSTEMLDAIIAGTEAANASFGINPNILDEARNAALQLGRGTLGNNVRRKLSGVRLKDEARLLEHPSDQPAAGNFLIE